MNKFLLTICLSLVSYSTISQAQPQKLIYCPEQISCAQVDNKDSCKVVGDNGTWPVIEENGRVVKGIYKFKGATAGYQSSKYIDDLCLYSNFDSGFEKTLTSRDAEGQMEAYPERTNKWVLIGYNATCMSSAPADCPMTEKYELTLDAQSEEVSFKVNNIPLESNHLSINTDYALSKCGKAKTCRIDIEHIFTHHYNKYYPVGFVVIDLENRLNILQVNNISTDRYIINKKPNFNGIIVAKNFK
ncbi:hypothetical protein [Aquicella siphonis]|uniref:hypothetical protein n=1 Tax=Aquicella siphonis TaxID=254247 RepID=UPI0011DD0967|nr:hypothetical protein [Aquicella siphonis]